MKIDILSLFPSFFESPLQVSILKRAIDNGIIDINCLDIRDFSKDKHNRVDDRPFGGGPGMVLSPQPSVDAIRSVKTESSHVVCLTPQGSLFSSQKAKELSQKKHLILFCGHYEGIDERVIQTEVDEEISIGDYILTSGCLPALVVIDAMARYIPNVLGHPESAYEDSFENMRFEGPQYTRPKEFEGHVVPEVLMSGHHKEILDYRTQKGMEKMRISRPDLYQSFMKKELIEK
ncbi:MAG TPA: tRNA (guanosine(37)-N1)-methyltransferase TrmD [Chlamydiales bacterium]|nr:tRNA (guanosine(37)-N1)-methyltransferase TrmD [Chlamydiales bacterium]